MLSFAVDLCFNITCPIAGETCDSGICKCGLSSSCISMAYSCKSDGSGNYLCDDPCTHHNLCQHNGNCTNLNDGNGGYKCDCDGYYGRNCEKGK